MKDSIAAIATASGRGGIGVVRVSGPAARWVAQQVCAKPLQARHAQYTEFVDADGAVIDAGIALLFVKPNSFTGEDVLELQGHGGPVVMQMLLRRVLACADPSRPETALRLARPGEFTERAYLNDKLDLAQAEAVADLIDAQTEQAARLATRSLQGEFSQKIQQAVQALIKLRMLVEATLDFPEEEIDFLEAADARGQLAAVKSGLQAILAASQQGALLRNGINVVLVGAPNVGKSSLLNALAGQNVAIVTPIAGTTRDKVVQAIAIEGIALNIIDTAGLRPTHDPVEQMGIDRTWQAIGQADLILSLQAVGIDDDPQLLKQVQAAATAARHVPLLRVLNKIDLLQEALAAETQDNDLILISAQQGLGLDQLRQRMLAAVGWQSTGEGLVLARERQIQALAQALVHIEAASQQAAPAVQQWELMAEELRLAQVQLNSITGEFSPDDLLGEIFSRFCIGK